MIEVRLGAVVVVGRVCCKYLPDKCLDVAGYKLRQQPWFEKEKMKIICVFT